jgi:hypothetical protein
MSSEDCEIKVVLPKDSSDKVGIAVARRIFEARGNHSEIHLSEMELATIVAMSIDLVFKKMVVTEVG